MTRAMYLRPQNWHQLTDADRSGIAYVAGATEVIPLMRSGILRPTALLDLSDVLDRRVEARREGISIGALARLSDVAADANVNLRAPALAQSLLVTASAQIRNTATVGGNLLQRTRCAYFREPAFECNKRALGAGCAAMRDDGRSRALFGSSKHCAAIHASDLAVALVALDATLALRDPKGRRRTLRVEELYCPPGDRPDRDTVLSDGEIIVGVQIPDTTCARRSMYTKLRERAAFDFALVSAAVALDVEGGHIREARIAAGGVATVPWRLRDVEARLQGREVTASAIAAAFDGFDLGAQAASGNAFKLRLLRRLATRTLTALSGAA